MAELSFSRPWQPPSTGTGGGDLGVARRVIIRTGGFIPANTAIDVNAPGLGWDTDGQNVAFSGSKDFVQRGQVYRNGQMLLTGETASDNTCVYFVTVSGTLAFSSSIRTNDIIQIWSYSAVISGTI